MLRASAAPGADRARRRKSRVGREEGYVLHLAVVSTFCTQWLIPRLRSLRRCTRASHLNLSVRSGPFAFDESGLTPPFITATGSGDTEGCMVVPRPA